jgi:hypothetical protein
LIVLERRATMRRGLVDEDAKLRAIYN